MLPPLLSSARLRLNGAGLPEVSQSPAARDLFLTHSRRQLSPRTAHNGTSRPSGVRASRSQLTEPSLPSRPPNGRLPPPGTQPPLSSSARLRLNGAGLAEVSQSPAARVLFSTHSRRQLSPRTAHNGTLRPSGVRAFRSQSTEPSLPSRPRSGRPPPPGTLPPLLSSARPSPGTDGGDSAEPPSLAVLWSLDKTLSPQTTLPHRRALPGASTGVWSRGTLTLRPTHSTAMAGTDLAMGAMEAMAMG